MSVAAPLPLFRHDLLTQRATTALLRQPRFYAVLMKGVLTGQQLQRLISNVVLQTDRTRVVLKVARPLLLLLWVGCGFVLECLF